MMIPGDKSISHRVAMLAAIAAGPCRIDNFNSGADCASTIRCLQQLGVMVRSDLEIVPATLRSSEKPLDCGNSGSTIRMLTGLLAGQNVTAILTGDASLQRRPMSRVADPLRRMGASIELRDENHAPIILWEGVKNSIQYEMPVSSAQVKSAILFAGLRLRDVRVVEPVPSRDHTERLFQYLGIQPGPDVRIPSFNYVVPGDPSSAAFFVIAALMRKKAEITISNVLFNPHRIAYVRLLQRCGAQIDVSDEKMIQNEPVADLRVRSGGALQPIVIGPEEVSALIDEVPALSVLGTTCGFEISGAAELRVKESDRIHAMTVNLHNLGIRVEEWPDGYRIHPGVLRLGVAQTFGDHRIAMAFAAAGLEVDDRECVRISLPEFFEMLSSFHLKS